MDSRPNDDEIKFLKLAYNRFYDLYEEITMDNFWTLDCDYRFLKIKDVFAIYSELLGYEPIKWIIELMKKHRPPMEAEIGDELFKFIRHVITHFPLFSSWDEVFVTKSLINWKRNNGQFINNFLEKYKGNREVKYRFWEEDKKTMTYLTIKFPVNYTGQEVIYLNNILSEKDGVKFSLILMKRILDTQVEN